MNKDIYYMNSALKEAEKAYFKKEIPVGAVLVYNDKIVSRAHNLREIKKNILYHAEILVLQKACSKLKNWRLNKSVLYVTLEPCLMCIGAIIQSRIEKLVFGALDKKAGAVESILNISNLKLNHKLDIQSGVLKDKSEKILKDFFKELRLKKKGISI